MITYDHVWQRPVNGYYEACASTLVHGGRVVDRERFQPPGDDYDAPPSGVDRSMFWRSVMQSETAAAISATAMVP